MAEPYVTPERFKTMGFGVDLGSIEDFELRSVLARASDRVNTMCAVPGLPQPHDFRGGTITDEEHHWKMGDGVSQESQRTVYVWHYPLRTVTDLRIRLTNSQGIVFDPGELMVFDREIEIVSLAMTSAGLFGAFIVPEIGLSQPRIVASYTYGYRIPITQVTVDATDGLTYRGQDQWWDDDEDVTVFVDSVEVDSSEYSIDHDEGTVTFEDPQGPDARVQVSYTTKLPRAIATATGILAAESLGDAEMRARGMTGLSGIRVGEIELTRIAQQRGGTTLVTPAQAEAESLLAPFRFAWAGIG